MYNIIFDMSPEKSSFIGGHSEFSAKIDAKFLVCKCL